MPYRAPRGASGRRPLESLPSNSKKPGETATGPTSKPISSHSCRSALLHDVGKIGIPDAILKSDKPLTNDQYDLVKTHTTIGANILSVITTFEHLPEGARYHHERYDGSGYPEGLSGNDIPLIGRIVAVADVYDAMTSKRRYKDGIGKEEVLAEMERDSGTKFDPTVVEAFIRTLCE